MEGHARTDAHRTHSPASARGHALCVAFKEFALHRRSCHARESPSPLHGASVSSSWRLRMRFARGGGAHCPAEDACMLYAARRNTACLFVATSAVPDVGGAQCSAKDDP